MPEICRFYGIIIRIYFNDHFPRHFHAAYGDDEAVIDIDTLALLSGHIPGRALGLVIEWASLHQTELRACWEDAKNLRAPQKIDPLP
ncbi:MAG TPA: DUF4160 domain-containing protein [Candidatus Binatia bacterium]|nr:DUF4160 domain-containing protein [Candidatus Binatia bacterium]